ncbi:MAG: hypothetical protein R3A46_14630 [Thermomicrobiales bacterium]
MNFKRLWRKIAILLTVALLAVPVLVVDAAPGQKGPPDDKGRPGDKGAPPGLVDEEPSEEVRNSLSVPALFVAGNPFGVDCALTAADPPDGDPLTGYEVPGYYYVQGTHQWQAQCGIADPDTVSATAAWGDNLTGAPLKSGTPIRVEIGLLEDGLLTDAMEGYNVIKLQPSLADRYSAYGITAIGDPLTGFSAVPITSADWGRVFDAQAMFRIDNVDTGEVEVPLQQMSAEINSTGRVVYGFNWGVSEDGTKDFPPQGTYKITFMAPNVNITGVSAGDTTFTSDTATITVQVGAKGGKGGGGGGKGPKPKDQMQVFSMDQLQTHDRIENRDGTCLLP